MKNLIVASLMLLSATSCGKTNKEGTDEITKYPPVETNPPNTNYSPAFTGQTRTFGIRTKAKLTFNILNQNLQSPWGLAQLPNNNWLITQKSGTMVILDENGTLKTTITGLPALNNQGQGGLLDVQLDPDFNTNRMVFWTFAEPSADGNRTAVAKGRLNEQETAIENIAVIYRAGPGYNGTLHYGGRIAFDNLGNIFLSTGERSDMVTRPLAQEKSTALGKILRITKDGQPAAGNPFNASGELAEIFTYGHRNPQGLAFDVQTNTLWQTEFGPKGGDEINKIEIGRNYGWPVITYGLEYSGATIGEGITQKEGMEQPIYYWDPVISPSGMILYNKDYHAEWKGNLLIACLSGQHIARIRLVNGKVEGEERLLEEEAQRFRAIAAGNDGKVYAVTDQGRFYQIGKE
jgi:glucose/arabinose dehydrogenase